MGKQRSSDKKPGLSVDARWATVLAILGLIATIVIAWPNFVKEFRGVYVTLAPLAFSFKYDQKTYEYSAQVTFINNGTSDVVIANTFLQLRKPSEIVTSSSRIPVFALHQLPWGKEPFVLRPGESRTISDSRSSSWHQDGPPNRLDEASVELMFHASAIGGYSAQRAVRLSVVHFDQEILMGTPPTPQKITLELEPPKPPNLTAE